MKKKNKKKKFKGTKDLIENCSICKGTGKLLSFGGSYGNKATDYPIEWVEAGTEIKVISCEHCRGKGWRLSLEGVNLYYILKEIGVVFKEE